MPAMPAMKDLWHHLAPIAGTFHYFFAFIIGAAAVAIRKYMQRVRENRAAMWPSADGQVQSAPSRNTATAHTAAISPAKPLPSLLLKRSADATSRCATVTTNPASRFFWSRICK